MIPKESDFPRQGWKIFISSELDESSELLFTISNFLIKEGLAFKYISNKYELFSQNEKYSDRVDAGKFIVIYPKSQDDFLELLDQLKEITFSYSK